MGELCHGRGAVARRRELTTVGSPFVSALFSTGAIISDGAVALAAHTTRHSPLNNRRMTLKIITDAIFCYTFSPSKFSNMQIDELQGDLSAIKRFRPT